MSIRLMSQAWELEDIKGNELLLLLALCDHANDEGTCYPSINRLSKKCRVGRRSVQRLMSGLIKRGIIKRQINEAKGGSNLYSIQINNGGDTEVTRDTKVTNDMEDIGGVTPQPPKPSMEPSNKEYIKEWFQKFTEMALANGLPKPRSLTPQREKQIALRIKEDQGEKDIITEIPLSDWLTGKTVSWSATLDWVLKKNNWNRILEGEFRNREEIIKNDHAKSWWRTT